MLRYLINTCLIADVVISYRYIILAISFDTLRVLHKNLVLQKMSFELYIITACILPKDILGCNRSRV
jgi:hypothetical protein